MKIDLHRFSWVALCSALAVASPADKAAVAGDGPAAAPAEFRVAGYLPDYRVAQFNLQASAGLTDLILFSAELTAAGELDLARLKNVPWAKFREFKRKHRIRLILCVGGWERSTQFAPVARTSENRRAFAKAATRVCLDERLDGIDVDWEHPRNAAEQENYGQLLTELRSAFQPHGLKLSVTIAAWQKLPAEAFQAVDWIQVMA